MDTKALQRQQLNTKLRLLAPLLQVQAPSAGWVKAIRKALGISMQQLGNKLGVSKQAILEMEKREQLGSITLNSLKEAAKAMDLQLVYALVPAGGSLDDLIERRAYALAQHIVMRTAQTMHLEDQANSPERIEQAIQERAATLQRDMPKWLWD
jgi:predicted DNA-binding mobile mystery protein A